MRYGFACFAAGALALSLTACNTNSERLASGDAPDEDRYHEKSFSWTETDGPLAKSSALAALAARHTRFSSAEEMMAALQSLNERLDDKAFTDSLWKPLDYVCDELDLAAWNTYGTIWLGDSVVFDETRLRERCRLSDEITTADTEGLSDSVALGKTAGWKWWNESEVVDRQYPYKMIGRSWDNFNLVVYKSTGGETQFEKRRSKFGVTAWWDTDASRIGVRIYLFDCGKIGTQRVCYYRTNWNSWYKDDDYVSKRDLAVGQVTINSNTWPSVRPASLVGSDAVLSMHSVNHAGLLFRAYSTSGLTNTITEETIFPEYVTW